MYTFSVTVLVFLRRQVASGLLCLNQAQHAQWRLCWMCMLLAWRSSFNRNVERTQWHHECFSNVLRLLCKVTRRKPALRRVVLRWELETRSEWIRSDWSLLTTRSFEHYRTCTCTWLSDLLELLLWLSWVFSGNERLYSYTRPATGCTQRKTRAVSANSYISLDRERRAKMQSSNDINLQA